MNFHKVYDAKTEKVNFDDYFVFETITPPNDTNLVWQFFSHMTTHCVDFSSMCSLRSQLPNASKEINLDPSTPEQNIKLFTRCKDHVFIHPGRHWQSKTFPKLFWDSVVDEIIRLEKMPVLIGANTDDNRGTVDINAQGCLDLRNELSINDSIYLLKHAKVLLTNDSAPLHMAASGEAWIGFVATCKHPDLITHWRHGEFGWRMQNFGKGGIWDILDYCPNKPQEVSVENVGDENLKSWLPDPKEFAQWACSKLN